MSERQRPAEATGPPSDAVPAAGDPLVRLGFVLTLVLLVVLLVVAARSQPIVEEARLGQRVELVELIRSEQLRVSQLQEKVDELSAGVAEAEAASPSRDGLAVALQADIDGMVARAGLTPLRGPGVVATLTDSPLSTSPSGDLNDLVIHEQDLQAVINALWAGGAEGVSVMGQRVLATTAIRCVGNTLLLHGAVYSPPYVIEALGDPVELQAALDRDPVVSDFRRAVEEFEVGFAVSEAEVLELPASDAGSTMQVARPVGDGTGG